MTRITVLSGHDLGVWRQRWLTGDAPAAMPYEVDALEASGLSVSIVGRTGGRVVTKLRDVVEHRCGLSLQVPLRAAATTAGADLTMALLETEGRVPAWFNARGLPPFARRPLVVWSCWLGDDLTRADAVGRADLYRRFRHVDLITHMSRHEKEIFIDSGFREEQLFPVTFGVSHRYYVPGPEAERDLDILAIGQDRGRDYGTLFDAVRGTDLRVGVVCKPENLAGLRPPDNVDLMGTVSQSAYRALLRRAKVIAVPTRVLSYPTGSSVALEAAASGCCVIATHTPAMADYIQDGVSGLLVPVGDSGAWRETLLRVRADDDLRLALGRGARRSVEERFNAEFMWTELASVMRTKAFF